MKPTECQKHLHPKSVYPSSLKNRIAYSQALQNKKGYVQQQMSVIDIQGIFCSNLLRKIIIVQGLKNISIQELKTKCFYQTKIHKK